MADFLSALAQYTFLQNAVLAGLLASVACGVMGTFVVARRITYLAGGIAHSILAGLGAVYYLNQVHHWTLLKPVHGAALAAVVSALIIGWVSLRARQREDTVIGAIWAIGMATGILFIAMTPGYNQELMSYLFGNILMVSGRDLWLMLALDAVLLALVYVFYGQFLTVCFDPEFANVRGIRVDVFYLLLLVLTALTVVVQVAVVGVVLVIALLTIPVAIAERFVSTMGRVMVVAAAVSMILTLAGLALSYRPNLPAGATTIALAGLVYLLVLAGGRFFGRRAA